MSGRGLGSGIQSPGLESGGADGNREMERIGSEAWIYDLNA
jgi:hypothetical protein